MIIIRVGDRVASEWVRRLFEADVFIRQVLGFTAGSAQPVLNIRLVERLLTPLPSLAEQQALGEVLVGYEQRLEAEQREQQKLLLLKKGLMEDLLTGRVRVTELLEKDSAA